MPLITATRLEMGLRALGGSYQSIKAGEATGLNPLWVETDAPGREWLTDALISLLESRGAQLTPQQTHAVQAIVRRNAEASDPSLRNWTEFAGQFRSVDDGGDLAERVREWAPKGRFGWVFGTSTEDTFSLDGDVVGFDLTGLLDADNETARMAVLSYIFRRIERKIEDRRPTIVLIDEAWKAFGQQLFRDETRRLAGHRAQTEHGRRDDDAVRLATRQIARGQHDHSGAADTDPASQFPRQARRLRPAGA